MIPCYLKFVVRYRDGSFLILGSSRMTSTVAWGAVHGWCGSRRHSPGGSAYREGEGTGTGLEWQCVDGAGVGGTRLAAVFEGNERSPALA